MSDADAPESPSGLHTASDVPDAVRHIERLIPGLAIIISAALGLTGNRAAAVGFLIGAVVAYINFRWLKSTVRALADAITDTGPPQSRPSVVLRFLTRFILIVLVAYVIFASCPLAFHGFLGGIFVPVLAIFLEAARVTFTAIRPRR